MNNPRTRSSLMAVAAAYLIYLAYQLYQDKDVPDTTMTPTVRILFICFFGIAAIGLLIYAWRIWKNAPKEEEEKKDEDSLK